MSLILSRTQNIRANSGFDKYELRPSRYGGLDFFMAETNSPTGIISKELKDKAFASIGSTLQVPVIDYDGGTGFGQTGSQRHANTVCTAGYQGILASQIK